MDDEQTEFMTMMLRSLKLFKSLSEEQARATGQGRYHEL